MILKTIGAYAIKIIHRKKKTQDGGRYFCMNGFFLFDIGYLFFSCTYTLEEENRPNLHSPPRS